MSNPRPVSRFITSACGWFSPTRNGSTSVLATGSAFTLLFENFELMLAVNDTGGHTNHVWDRIRVFFAELVESLVILAG